jgi:hypothetical protein
MRCVMALLLCLSFGAVFLYSLIFFGANLLFGLLALPMWLGFWPFLVLLVVY